MLAFFVGNMKITVYFIFLVLLVKTRGAREKRILLHDQDNVNTILSRLDALTKEVESLKAENKALTHRPVSFMVYLTKTVLGPNHHIYFDDVKLNIGNAYNPHHGTFVAPTNGTYLFMVTACSAVAHYVVLEIVVNDVTIGKTLAGDNGYEECTSKQFLSELKANDDVYVKHVATGDYLLANNVYGLPSFIGVLLSAH